MVYLVKLDEDFSLLLIYDYSYIFNRNYRVSAWSRNFSVK